MNTHSICLFLRKYGFRFFGVFLAFILYLRLDIDRIAGQIQNVDSSFFLLTVVCVNAVVILQAWRGYILLGEEKGKLGFRAYLHSYFVTMAASAAVPGRLGALAQVPLLHQRGVGIGVSFANVIYDKLYDLAGFLAMGAVFATILVTSDFTISLWMLAPFSIVTLVLIWYIDVFLSFGSGLLERIFPSLTAKWGCTTVSLNSRIKVYALFLTLVRLGGAVLVHWLGAQAAGANPQFVLVCAATVYSALSTLIPVSVMGVGLREGIFLLLFKGQMSEEQILAFAFLILLAYLSTVFIGIFLAVFAKKLNPKIA